MENQNKANAVMILGFWKKSVENSKLNSKLR